MRFYLHLATVLCLSGCIISPEEETHEPPPDEPLKLHQGNPNYLEFQGNPVILVTSAEHYGSVLNLDFDYSVYLSTLESAGLNYTRIFSGAYVERAGSFGIEKNTLAPLPGRFIAPWARSSQSGYANGGNKFDLSTWDDEYFLRLKDFVRSAGESGVFVEVTLFSSFYGENWELSPLHPSNNINGTPNLPHQMAQVVGNQGLFNWQEAMVRKIVGELNQFDNVFFEIQNEPWADNGRTVAPVNPYLADWPKVWQNRVDVAQQPSLDWQARIAAVIKDEEGPLPKKHLIAQNFCNFGYSAPPISDSISILNFHYAYPDAARLNLGRNRVIGFDESGFSGPDDAAYRQQAWRFILSGGGLFNSLDYSFYPGAEDGTGTNRAPGGGSATLRSQLGVLSRFINSVQFARMGTLASTDISCPDALAYGLARSYWEYVFYLEGAGPTTLTTYIRPGVYSVVWVDPVTGNEQSGAPFESPGRNSTLVVPAFSGEIAIRLTRSQPQD